MMYADSSVELKKKSELSQESAVPACKMYVPYISDITRQIEEVVKNICHGKRTKVNQKTEATSQYHSWHQENAR